MKVSCPKCGKKYRLDELGLYRCKCGEDLIAARAGEVVKCPKCGKGYEAWESGTGTCECGKVFSVGMVEEEKEKKIEPRVRKCPDCFGMVSTRASVCPHCGAPQTAEVAAESSTASVGGERAMTATPGVVREVIEKQDNKGRWPAIWLGVLVMVVGWIVASGSIRLVWCGIGMLICGIGSELPPDIHCLRCDYKGAGKFTGGASGLVFVLLLLIGILPGILYLALVKRKIKCPHCGLVSD